MLRSVSAAVLLAASLLVAAPAQAIIADEGPTKPTRPVPTVTEPALPPGTFLAEEEAAPGIRAIYQAGGKASSTDIRAVRKWYGMQVRFSRGETEFIGFGTASCAALVGLVAPPAGQILGAACGVLTVSADIAQHYGNCLAVNVYHAPGMVNPWYWHC